MQDWVEQMKGIAARVQRGGPGTQLTQEEYATRQRAGQFMREYLSLADRTGGMTPEQAKLVEQYRLSESQIGLMGERPARGVVGRLQRMLTDPKAAGLASEIYFTTRMLRTFIDPLIQGGQGYQEYQTQLNRQRMLGGMPINRQALAITRGIQERQMYRAQTGGYILAGLQPMYDQFGSQTMADITGIDPPISERRRGFFGLVVVALGKYLGALHCQFAGFPHRHGFARVRIDQLYFRIRKRDAH